MCYLLSYSNKLQCFTSFWYELMFCQMTEILSHPWPPAIAVNVSTLKRNQDEDAGRVNPSALAVLLSEDCIGTVKGSALMCSLTQTGHQGPLDSS